MRVHLPLAAVFCLGAGFWMPVAMAQEPAAPEAALSQAADAYFDRGQFKEAAAAYTQILQNYPASEFAPAAQFHLAYANFLTGDFSAAADGLRKLQTAPGTPAEMLADASLLLPEVLAQQAGALPASDPKNKAGFADAIDQYGQFLEKYPRSPDAEAALYGRAVAAYQIARYADAARDLRQILASFAGSPSILDSEFLLAMTIATQSNLALADAKAAAGSRDAALRGYDEAETLLRHIIALNSDIALANDAQFQLGETLMAHLAALPAPARLKLYEQALTAYRAVEPKPPMLAAQAARVQRLGELRIAELRKGAAADRTLIHQFEQERLREGEKLAALRLKDDPVLTAHLKSGSIYCNLGRYDETRVLVDALLPDAERPGDEKLGLYYLALSYAGQKQTDKAVEAYDRFQRKYAGDPLAENLPLVIGNLFLTGPKPDPTRANRYFGEFAKLYPQSRLRDNALLQQAEAAASLGHYDEALATVATFLKGQPKPDLVPTARLMQAGLLKDKGDLAGALTAYAGVRDEFAGHPEAEEAAFWIGPVSLQKGDPAGAVKALQAFAARFPQSKLLPAALLTLGQAQLAAGAKDQALATFADLSKRLPDSPEAISAYFQRANIYLNAHQYPEMQKALEEFVDRHPENGQALAACDRIAALEMQANQPEAAAATYRRFADRQPGSAQAPAALGKMAQVWLQAARALGPYIILSDAQRAAWHEDVARAIAAGELQLAEYPEAPASAPGLQTLLECQRMLVLSKDQTEEKVRAYFEGLAAKYQAKPAAHSRILFRLAALSLDADPARALAEMQAAYNPAVVYSPPDMAMFTQELMKGPDLTAASLAFDKLARDYPLPAGVAPADAPQEVQDAQAIALAGQGQIALKAGRLDEARQVFAELAKDYPKSPQRAQADLGLAEVLATAGKFDEALPLLAGVAKSPLAPQNARAHALFLNGQIQAAEGKDGAIDAYLKLAAFYPAAPEAAESLWIGGQLLEKQAAGLGDVPAKPGGPTRASQLARARKAYAELTAKYAASPFAEQARSRLADLPESLTKR